MNGDETTLLEKASLHAPVLGKVTLLAGAAYALSLSYVIPHELIHAGACALTNTPYLGIYIDPLINGSVTRIEQEVFQNIRPSDLTFIYLAPHFLLSPCIYDALKSSAQKICDEALLTENSMSKTGLIEQFVLLGMSSYTFARPLLSFLKSFLFIEKSDVSNASFLITKALGLGSTYIDQLHYRPITTGVVASAILLYGIAGQKIIRNIADSVNKINQN